MTELPRLALWVCGGERGEKFVVRQMPQPQTVICHFIGVSWDKDVLLLVLMRPLVNG